MTMPSRPPERTKPLRTVTPAMAALPLGAWVSIRH
jgi:hypothetical protein